jgi:hypothetical protein
MGVLQTVFPAAIIVRFEQSKSRYSAYQNCNGELNGALDPLGGKVPLKRQQ